MIDMFANREADSGMKPTYTLLDHTADLRIRVGGTDPAELYANAGLALFDLIAGSYPRSTETWLSVSVSGEDRADLLVNFLRELLYRWNGEAELVTSIGIEAISEARADARIGLVAYQPDVHVIAHEIKAVTYHQIEVVRTDAGWQATVVFDI